MLLAWLHCTTTLLLLSVLVSAQNIFPSNSSGDLYPANSSPRFILNGSEFHGVPNVPLAPLGPYAQIPYNDFVTISASGQLVNVGASNANNPVSKYQFSYVSCDPSAYTGNFDASDVFDIVVNQARASVIILYSETANHCTATDLAAVPSAIQSILTTTDPHSAGLLANLNLNIGSPGVCVISPDLSSYTNNTSLPGGGTAPGGTSTTAVAMIVLYSITGLITALFVVIIITGTVRAHRHPERYGPAATSGRGRQSRAKGIARAMLDTLPIVKFSGNREASNIEHPKPESDIEMRAPVAAADTTPTTTDATTTTTTNPSVPSPLPPAQTEQSHPAPALSTSAATPSEREQNADTTTAPAQAPSPSATPTPSPQASGAAAADHHLGCAICTDDFTQGEDVRVLPCNHKFHPDCVDPWLLNVSGTCPLCRIDLRPAGETGSDNDGGNGNADLPPPIPRATATGDSPTPLSDDGTRRRDTITFAHLRSLAGRNGSSNNSGAGALSGVEERLAILRRLRHERRNQRQQEEGGGGEGDGEGQGAEERETETERRGLARRFRERFRIRTVQSGGPSGSASAPPPGPGPGPGPGSIAGTLTT